MTNEQDVNQFRQYNSTNMDHINNNSFMLRRIDTDPLLGKFRQDLSGSVTFLNQLEDGSFIQQESIIGRPLASPEGVMRIMNLISMVVNDQTVQGNLNPDDYVEFMATFREEITDTIVKNCIDWDIQDKDLDSIINEIVRITYLFLTRPVQNKERESYQKEFQSREIVHTQPQKGALSSFASGIGK